SQVHISAVTGLPVTLGFGVSPGGFGTGEHEYNNFESVSRSVQSDILEPQLLRLNHIIAKTPGLEVPEHATMSIEFNGLRAKTDREKMEEQRMLLEAQKIRAETLAILTSGMIITPEEAAEALSMNDDWQIRIDRKDEEQARKDRIALVEDLRRFKESVTLR